MRRLLAITACLLLACGPEETAPERAPLTIEAAPEAPTPPPLSDEELAMPVEPPVPKDARPPEPRPEPTPKPAPTNVVPAGAKDIVFESVVLAKGVQNRQPVGIADSFADGQEITCFMRVRNPGPKRTLRHQWYHGDTRKSSVAISVGGPTWRTWTQRPVYGTGSWRVDIVDEAGEVLHTVPFEVK